MPVYTFVSMEICRRWRGIITKAKNISPLRTIMDSQYVAYVIKLRYIHKFIFSTYTNFIMLRSKASMYPILINVSLLNDQ